MVYYDIYSNYWGKKLDHIFEKYNKKYFLNRRFFDRDATV